VVRDAVGLTGGPLVAPTLRQSLNLLEKVSDYFQFLLLNTLYILFMSIAWPLFTITVTRVAKLDLAVI
jgi:hypothetical protein